MMIHTFPIFANIVDIKNHSVDSKSQANFSTLDCMQRWK